MLLTILSPALAGVLLMSVLQDNRSTHTSSVTKESFILRSEKDVVKAPAGAAKLPSGSRS